MPVDTSIYKNFKSLDPAGSIDRGMRMRDMIDDRKKKSAIQGAYKQGMQVGPDGKVAFDHNMTASALAKGGYGQEAYQAQQQGMGDQQKQMQAAVQKAQFGAQVLGAAKSQEDWDKGLQELGRYGMDISKIPPQFSPENQRFLVDSAMTLGDRLAQEWKQKEFGLKEREIRSKEKGGGASGLKPPPGYRFLQDGSLEAIPGGPAAEKSAEREEKERGRRSQSKLAGGTVVQDLGRALELVQAGGAAGHLVGLSSKMPYSPAKNAAKHIASAVSNIGFDQLNAMRANSPTGGALGNVTELQLSQLQQVLGSLELDQHKSVVEDNLKRAMNIYNDVIYGSNEDLKWALETGRMSQEQYAETMGAKPQPLELSFDDQGRSIAGPSRSFGIDKANAAGWLPKNLPKYGQVEDGYMYKGGDPSSPSSWEKK